jgi:hypothetical protein
MSREKFLRVYSNLPIKTREEIIVVMDGKPISWNVAYNEVKNNTRLGEAILIKLKKIGIM